MKWQTPIALAHGRSVGAVLAIALPACSAPPKPPAVSVESRSPSGVQQNARLCSTPRYPADALQADAEGTTRLLLDVSPEGQVLNATVMRSAGRTNAHKKLDEAAIDSFTECPFRPARDADGRPVRGKAIVEFHWKLEGQRPPP
ncbi:energy transducer TonB [Aquincola tertiaricarbonis]|uniref:energy transducer TonB n=1 Tax=Aquincola tertiaricarbonis TaxID=391953 RepID=UPI0018DDAAA4